MDRRPDLRFRAVLLIILCLFNVSCAERPDRTEIIDLTKKEDKAGVDKNLKDRKDTVDRNSETSEFSAGAISQEQTEYIICEIKGEIKKPGVYRLRMGDRLNDLVKLAGGMTERADTLAVNLAGIVEDGMSFIIPDRSADNTALYAMQSGKTGDNKDKRVNINTADKAELETIPGIGPATAENIIKYREDNGPFRSTDDIKNVNRIGDKTFEKIKDYIKIK